MFDVYAFATPNSIKVLIALEELGLDYKLHGINVRKGSKRRPTSSRSTPMPRCPCWSMAIWC
ncbi:hypothetical protein ACFS32_03280 [Novosphingobium pokkalii]|uniref:hypothetical protein n=1 Tax=Novosphingobium pokkalii TaxID=1770194 RepID=UPI00363A2BB5